MASRRHKRARINKVRLAQRVIDIRKHKHRLRESVKPFVTHYLGIVRGITASEEQHKMYAEQWVGMARGPGLVARKGVVMAARMGCEQWEFPMAFMLANSIWWVGAYGDEPPPRRMQVVPSQAIKMLYQTLYKEYPYHGDV